jgi:hypothetical protein
MGKKKKQHGQGSWLIPHSFFSSPIFFVTPLSPLSHESLPTISAALRITLSLISAPIPPFLSGLSKKVYIEVIQNIQTHSQSSAAQATDGWPNSSTPGPLCCVCVRVRVCVVLRLCVCVCARMRVSECVWVQGRSPKIPSSLSLLVLAVSLDLPPYIHCVDPVALLAATK